METPEFKDRKYLEYFLKTYGYVLGFNECICPYCGLADTNNNLTSYIYNLDDIANLYLTNSAISERYCLFCQQEYKYEIEATVTLSYSNAWNEKLREIQEEFSFNYRTYKMNIQ